MDFSLTEEQKQIKVLIKEFCQRELDAKKLKEISDKCTRSKNVEEFRTLKPQIDPYLEKLHKIGLRPLPIPEKYGGGGAGWVTMVIAAEALGYYACPIVDVWELAPVHWLMVGSPVNAPDDVISPQQKDEFFKKIMKNPTVVAAGAISDGGSGSDPHIPYENAGEVIARKEGNEWVLNGDKGFSTGAPMADEIMCLARTGKGHFADSSTQFVVPRTAKGFSMNLNRLGCPTLIGNGQCHFDNVRVSEEAITGHVGGGFRALEAGIGLKFPLYVCLLGTGEKIYEDAREFAKQRKGMGKPIIEHANVAERLGQMALEIEKARAFAFRAAWESDQRKAAKGPISMFWTLGCINVMKTMLWEISEFASEIFGGVAGSQELATEPFVRMAYSMLPTGTPRSVQAVKCNLEYDNRYNYMGKI